LLETEELFCLLSYCDNWAAR